MAKSGYRNLPENLAQLARDADYCVSAFAVKCGQSPRQLERRFRRELGITPKQYLDNLWLAHSLEALEKEGTVLGAALEMRYKCWHNFSRDFKQASGVSPSQALKLRKAGNGTETIAGTTAKDF